MKFYILCDIEGVASLTCWDEARSANACYAPMAREMALEAAAAARGLFSGGADEVVIEDMHGDGCNIDCALLPRDARLLRGITHDIVGLTGIFDESYDGMLMVGFHDAASAPGNPTSHTMVAPAFSVLRSMVRCGENSRCTPMPPLTGAFPPYSPAATRGCVRLRCAPYPAC